MKCNYPGCRRARKATTASGVRFGVCDQHLSLTPIGAPAPADGPRSNPARRWAPGASVSGLWPG